MLKNQIGNIDYITILEAVLTMGQTLDIDKECSKFVETLIDMGYTHTNVQIEDGEVCKCVKSSGNTSKDHKVVRLETGSNMPNKVKGFVEVYKETDFTDQELEYINVLVKRFQNAITACLCYRQAIREAELRQEVEEYLEQAKINIEKLSVEKQAISKELDIRIKKYTEEFEEIIRRLKEIALRDSMTGLYNRHQVLTLGKEAFEESIAQNREFSIIMLDIDDFKIVNDTYGHLVGDQVLEILGKRLKNAVKDKDLVGRYGGEEFVLFLFCGKSTAKEVGERIRHAIADRDFVVEDGIRLPITVSVGVAVKTSDDKAFESLLKRADEMLYEAKRVGKNKVVIS